MPSLPAVQQGRLRLQTAIEQPQRRPPAPWVLHLGLGRPEGPAGLCASGVTEASSGCVREEGTRSSLAVDSQQVRRISGEFVDYLRHPMPNSERRQLPRKKVCTYIVVELKTNGACADGLDVHNLILCQHQIVVLVSEDDQPETSTRDKSESTSSVNGGPTVESRDEGRENVCPLNGTHTPSPSTSHPPQAEVLPLRTEDVQLPIAPDCESRDLDTACMHGHN